MPLLRSPAYDREAERRRGRCFPICPMPNSP